MIPHNIGEGKALPNAACRKTMSLRASAHTGVAIRIPCKAEPCVCLRHTDDPLGSCRSTSDKENGSPHQPAGWFAMTSIFWAFSTVCSPLREGAKASFSAFHNFKFLIRIKEEGFFEIPVTYSSFSASIFQKQTTERRISYESHVSLCGLFRVGDGAGFVPVCLCFAGMKFFRNPVTFFHRDASIF